LREEEEEEEAWELLLLLLHNPQLQKAPQNSLQNVTIPLLPR
jgi:hypothetical protein